MVSRYMIIIWDENPSLAICGVDGNTTLTQYSMGWWEDDGMKIYLSIWNINLDLSQPWFGKVNWDLYQTWFVRGGMAHEKAASYLESTRLSVQLTTIRKFLFLGYAMRGYYTLEPLVYGFHHRGIRLVEIVEYPLSKNVGKDRSHSTSLINLYLGSRGQLMEPREVQKYSHTSGMLNTIRRNNFVYICLFHRLCPHQDQNHQKLTLIRS